MDVLEEIHKLLQVKHGVEATVLNRGRHITWLWIVVGFMMTTGAGWVIAGAIWYAKMEHVARAVDLIFEKVFGYKMP